MLAAIIPTLLLGLSICCSVLGLFLIEEEPPQLNEAERLPKRAIDLYISLGRFGGAAAAYGNPGLAKVKRGDLAAARDLFQRALGIYQRANRPRMALRIQGMIKTVGTLSAARAVSTPDDTTRQATTMRDLF